MERNKNILVTCFPRISSILEREIRNLGYEVKSRDKTGVSMKGGWNEIMKLNLHLRTANRVLWEIKSFKASTPAQLYDEIKKIKWHLLIRKNGYFTVQSFVKNDHIRDTRFPNLKIKDAIADYYQELLGTRPNSGPLLDQTVLYLYWVENEATLYFDTSGEAISKHGYRKNPWKAPMMESLAAAVILSSNWEPESGNFINPMCGSGTLAIEAALMASNAPGSWHRSNFGFMHIVGFDPKKWQAARKEAKSGIITPKQQFIASDISKKAVEIAMENARVAKVEKLIRFETCDFRDTPIPPGKGIVFLNPEYGERLGDKQKLQATYQAIGDFFKKKCSGYTGYIFTGDLKLAKKVGLKPKRKTEFLNAKIDSRLIEYELYQGTKTN